MAQTSDLNSHSYLALGDSYTIGEGVPLDKNWPNQLILGLNSGGIAFDPPRIIATTGWTTDELIEAIGKEETGAAFDLVSLLIGVNNQYRGYPIEQYRIDFKHLLDMALAFSRNNSKGVFVVSIPDYGVTPFGKTKGSSKIARELEEYNAIAREICLDNNIRFINITEISQQASTDTELTISDNLHPSAKMHGLWVERISPIVEQFLAD